MTTFIKHTVVLFILILSYNTIHACSCAYFEDRFCANASNMQSVVFAEVVSRVSEYSIEINVLESLDNKISKETIIVESRTSCSENLNRFSLSDTLILALDNFDNKDEWDLFGSCGKYFLRVHNGNVIGQINNVDTLQDYNLFVENFNTCLNFGIVPVEDFQEKEQTLHIMPNPTTESMSINIENGTIQQVNIYNSDGQVVLKNRSSNSSSFDLTTSILQSGIYYAQVYTVDKVLTQKFLKL